MVKAFLLTIALSFVSAKFAIAQSSSPGCEPSSKTQKVLDALQTPQDIQLSAREIKDKQLSLLEPALQASPNDIFLLRKRQDLELGTLGHARAEVARKYDGLLKQHPDDPLYLYLTARAHVSLDTKQAISYLQRAITKAPEFAWPRLLLAEIHQSQSFKNDAETRANLETFRKLCPSSLASFSLLRWSDDHELIAQTIDHLRLALGDRTDSEAASAYSTIWYLGGADGRPEKQEQLREQIKRDIAILWKKEFPRNLEWYRVMQQASDLVDDRKIERAALEEMSAAYPKSDFRPRVEIARWRDSNARPPSAASDETTKAHAKAYFEQTRRVSHLWPQGIYPAVTRWHAVGEYENAPEKEASDALDMVLAALEEHPDGFLSNPPFHLSIAQQMLKRGVRVQDVPAVVAKGLEVADRFVNNSDLLNLRNRQARATHHVNSYVHGYLLLADAYLRLNQAAKAQEILFKTDERLAKIRPDEKASGEDKARFGELEARYWQAKGKVAEKESRKLDALVLYRNSLVAFPPRRPRPDSRDEVMEAAQRLWKEMGGTEQGWSEWAARSSLSQFNAGVRGANAWQIIAKARPDLVLTDWQGRQWKPSELKNKTTFVNYWAIWCGPCRAELPYVQKLYERFKDHPEIVILSLNVDDDPAVQVPVLKKMGLTLPSIAARDFGYEFLPVMALPSNWIVTEKGNEMFTAEGSLDKWMEAVVAALEKASKN